MTTTLTMEPGPIVATVEVRGHARCDWSPRRTGQLLPAAWATVQTADGRHGVGWLEWNTNQRD